MILFEIPRARENEEVKQTRNESLMNNKDAKTCETIAAQSKRMRAGLASGACESRRRAESDAYAADSPHAFVLISFSQLHRRPHIRHPRNAPQRNE